MRDGSLLLLLSRHSILGIFPRCCVQSLAKASLPPFLYTSLYTSLSPSLPPSILCLPRLESRRVSTSPPHALTFPPSLPPFLPLSLQPTAYKLMARDPIKVMAQPQAAFMR